MKQFEGQFKALAEADSLTDNFSSITSEIKNWFQQKLTKYEPSDHPLIADFAGESPSSTPKLVQET